MIRLAVAADALQIATNANTWRKARPDLYGTAVQTRAQAQADLRAHTVYVYEDAQGQMRGHVYVHETLYPDPDTHRQSKVQRIADITLDPVLTGGAAMTEIMAFLTARKGTVRRLAGEVTVDSPVHKWFLANGYREFSRFIDRDTGAKLALIDDGGH